MNASKQNSNSLPEHINRRQFLRNSTLAVAGGVAAASFPSILHGQEKAAINAVIIGVGGRGAGAGKDFLDASKIAGIDGKIVAVADIFPDQAARANHEFGVPEDK